MTRIDRSNLSYRKAVTGFVVDDDGKFLLIQNNVYKDNEWRSPGGGIKEGESEEEALMRELEEELGTNDFKIIKKSKHRDRYDWSDEYVNMRGDWRGQIRTQFLVKFEGAKKDIKIDRNELKKAKWVKLSEMSRYLNFDNQKEKTRKVLRDFGFNI